MAVQDRIQAFIKSMLGSASIPPPTPDGVNPRTAFAESAAPVLRGDESADPADVRRANEEAFEDSSPAGRSGLKNPAAAVSMADRVRLAREAAAQADRAANEAAVRPVSGPITIDEDGRLKAPLQNLNTDEMPAELRGPAVQVQAADSEAIRNARANRPEFATDDQGKLPITSNARVDGVLLPRPDGALPEKNSAQTNVINPVEVGRPQIVFPPAVNPVTGLPKLDDAGNPIPDKVYRDAEGNISSPPISQDLPSYQMQEIDRTARGRIIDSPSRIQSLINRIYGFRERPVRPLFDEYGAPVMRTISEYRPDGSELQTTKAAYANGDPNRPLITMEIKRAGSDGNQSAEDRLWLEPLPNGEFNVVRIDQNTGRGVPAARVSQQQVEFMVRVGYRPVSGPALGFERPDVVPAPMAGRAVLEASQGTLQEGSARQLVAQYDALQTYGTVGERQEFLEAAGNGDPQLGRERVEQLRSLIGSQQEALPADASPLATVTSQGRPQLTNVGPRDLEAAQRNPAITRAPYFVADTNVRRASPAAEPDESIPAIGPAGQSTADDLMPRRPVFAEVAEPPKTDAEIEAARQSAIRSAALRGARRAKEKKSGLTPPSPEAVDTARRARTESALTPSTTELGLAGSTPMSQSQVVAAGPSSATSVSASGGPFDSGSFDTSGPVPSGAFRSPLASGDPSFGKQPRLSLLDMLFGAMRRPQAAGIDFWVTPEGEAFRRDSALPAPVSETVQPGASQFGSDSPVPGSSQIRGPFDRAASPGLTSTTMAGDPASIRKAAPRVAESIQDRLRRLKGQARVGMREALDRRKYYDTEIASLQDYIKTYEQTIAAQTAQWRQQLAPAYEQRLGLLEALEAAARRIAGEIEAKSGQTLDGLNAALASDPQLSGIRDSIQSARDGLAQMRAADDARIEEGLRPYREHVANFQQRLEALRQNQLADVNRAAGKSRTASRGVLDIQDDALLANAARVARERVKDVDTVADPALRQQASDRLADAEASQDIMAEGGSLLPKSTSAFKRTDLQKAFQEGMRALGFDEVQLPPALRTPESRSASARPSKSSTEQVEAAQKRLNEADQRQSEIFKRADIRTAFRVGMRELGLDGGQTPTAEQVEAALKRLSSEKRQSGIISDFLSAVQVRRDAQRDVSQAQEEVKALANRFLKSNSPVQQRDSSASNTRRLYEAIVDRNTSPAKRLAAVEDLLGVRGKRGAGQSDWRPPMLQNSLPPMTAEKVLDVIRNRLANTLPGGTPAPTNEDILTALIREALSSEVKFLTEKGDRSFSGDIGDESARVAAQAVIEDLRYSRPSNAAERVAGARVGEYAPPAEPKGGVIRNTLSRLQEIVSGRKKPPVAPDPNAPDKLDVFWRMLPTEEFIDSLPSSELWRAEEMIANTERMLGNASGFRGITDPTALTEQIASLKRVLGEAVYKSQRGTQMLPPESVGVERGVSAAGKAWAPDVLKTADELRAVQAEIMNLVRRQNVDPGVQDELGRLLGEEERLKSMLPANDVPLSPLEPRRSPPPAGEESQFEEPKLDVGGAEDMAAKRAEVAPKYTFSVPANIAGRVQEAARKIVSEIRLQIRDIAGGSSSSGQKVQISFDGGAETFEVEMINASDTNNVAGRIGNYTLDLYPVTGDGVKKGLLEPAIYDTGLSDGRQSSAEGASPQQQQANAPKPPVEEPPASGQQTADALTAAALRGEEVQVGATGEADVVQVSSRPTGGRSGRRGKRSSARARTSRSNKSVSDATYDEAPANQENFSYEGESFVLDEENVEADATGLPQRRSDATGLPQRNKPSDKKGLIQRLRESKSVRRAGNTAKVLGLLGAGYGLSNFRNSLESPALADAPYVPLPAPQAPSEDTNKKREKTLSRVRGARGARGSKRYGYLTTQNPLPY